MEKIKDTKWAYKFIQKHSTRAFPKEHQSKGNYGLWYVTQSWKTHYGSCVKVHFKHMKMCICVTHIKIPLVFDQGDNWCNNSLRRQKLTWTLNHDNVIQDDYKLPANFCFRVVMNSTSFQQKLFPHRDVNNLKRPPEVFYKKRSF